MKLYAHYERIVYKKLLGHILYKKNMSDNG
jgi:hypothetical protein